MIDPAAPVFVSDLVARSVFRWNEAIERLQAAYAQSPAAAAIPPRSMASDGKASLRSMAAVSAGGRYYGAKLMGMSFASATPAVEYLIVLFDRETSRIAGLLDGNAITAFRTAATSAAAVDRLIAPGPIHLAVLGSGLEAAMHTRAIATIRRLESVTVFSPTPDRRNAFAKALTTDLGVSAQGVETAEAAVRGADLVLATARSRDESPILYSAWLKDGSTVVSIGSTIPQQREIDVSVVEWSDLIVCDTLLEVLDGTGDMIAAQAAGIAFKDKAVSLADVMSGACAARIAAAKAPMYKSVGAGLQDIVVAELILTRALENGSAQPLPISFETKYL